ncbi:MAG TPA: hypothetical protein DE060_02620 [Lentisphaeria bacterium]|nr:hypothetical protein [Lentisphaeria bacterium]
MKKNTAFLLHFAIWDGTVGKPGKTGRGKKLNPVLFYLFFRRCLFAVFSELPAVPHDFFKRV